jgi:hypothetical protein
VGEGGAGSPATLLLLLLPGSPAGGASPEARPALAAAGFAVAASMAAVFWTRPDTVVSAPTLWMAAALMASSLCAQHETVARIFGLHGMRAEQERVACSPAGRPSRCRRCCNRCCCCPVSAAGCLR